MFSTNDVDGRWKVGHAELLIRNTSANERGGEPGPIKFKFDRCSHLHFKFIHFPPSPRQLDTVFERERAK